MKLKLLTQDWNDQHQTDGVAEVHDDVEGGVVGGRDVEHEQHVQVEQELYFDDQPVEAEPEELQKYQKL